MDVLEASDGLRRKVLSDPLLCPFSGNETGINPAVTGNLAQEVAHLRESEIEGDKFDCRYVIAYNNVI